MEGCDVKLVEVEVKDVNLSNKEVSLSKKEVSPPNLNEVNMNEVNRLRGLVDDLTRSVTVIILSNAF